VSELALQVRIGEHHLTKEKVALKLMSKSDIMSMGAAERTTTEIQCLTALRHPHIITLLQVRGKMHDWLVLLRSFIASTSKHPQISFSYLR
jgi:serine/threonine protein kinase